MNTKTTHKVKNVELVKEDGAYYLDITYELENNARVEELHIPRVMIPFCSDMFPEILVENEFEDLFKCIESPRPFSRIQKVTLRTGCGNNLPVKKDNDGYHYTIKTIKTKTQKMTVAEIEKKLGYKIEIVSEDKK